MDATQLYMYYLALVSSSPSFGSHLVTMIPRFILAGSRAQLEIPMNATLSSRSTTLTNQHNESTCSGKMNKKHQGADASVEFI